MNTQTNQTLDFSKNDIIEGEITGAATFGFHVSVKVVNGKEYKGKSRVLLVNNQISGRTDEDREERRKGLKIGEKVKGLCTRAEFVEAKNPGLKGKKLAQYAISERALIAKVGRENREARESIEQAILDLPKGTEVTGVVVENRPGLGAFVEVSEGPAKGRRALIHVSEVSDDRSKEVRDEVLATIVVGETVTAKLCKVERNAKNFLDIGLSLKDATREARAEQAQADAEEFDVALLERFPVTCEMTARVAKKQDKDADGLIMTVSQDGVEAVLSCDTEMAEKVNRSGSTRIRITGVRNGRLLAEKA